MKKVFLLILGLFLFSTFLFNITSQTNAAPTNINDKCVVCPRISGYESHTALPSSGFRPDGLPPELNPGYYCDGTMHNGAQAPDCIQEDQIDYYCIYESDTAPNYNYFIANPSLVSNACTGSQPTCQTAQGCVSEDTPAPTECRFAQGESDRGTNCRTQEFCKDGGNPNCADYYCVDTLSNPLSLASYEDVNAPEKLKCRRADTPPECDVEDDPEACDDPFEEREQRECEVQNGRDEFNCFSGWCDENYKCTQGYAAFNCNYSGGEFTCKTALGKINTNPERFVQNILQILLGISGGILLVLIIFNGYKLMTSQGDPEKLKDAREGIIAAIAGILLVIFSITLLQFITVDILGIPGFG